jgi:predicted nucleotidyltransferase component of viral defense system
MLYLKTVEPNTLSILRALQGLPELADFYLVGGTALALKYGHRLSIDIDLFGKNFDKELIITACQRTFGSNFYYENSQNNWAIFCFIENIKVDIIHYKHLLLEPLEKIEGITFLSAQDIAAMKINAILGRASKKDFWDIYELLQHYKLEEIIDFHMKKYPNQMLLISIPQALSYFEEAEESADPVSLKGQNWEEIKSFIQEKIREYLI